MIDVSLGSLVELDRMLELFPQRTKEAARLAINQTARREALSRVRKDMREQINWKASYLNDSSHTGIAKLATRNRLSAALYARDKPTMLNRFRNNPNSVPEKVKAGKGKGVRVRVKPNSAKVIKKAFVHKFGNGNVGVLVRTKGGISEPPKGITNGGGRYITSMRAWLLYAPSIDQVMWDTAKRNEAKIALYLRTEFLRQFGRLNKL